MTLGLGDVFCVGDVICIYWLLLCFLSVCCSIKIVPFTYLKIVYLLSNAQKKLKSILIKLVSAAGTGFFYTTRKSISLGRKLALRKYDPVVRQHVIFEESKISKGKKK